MDEKRDEDGQLRKAYEPPVIEESGAFERLVLACSRTEPGPECGTFTFKAQS